MRGGAAAPPPLLQVYINTLRQAEEELAVLQPKGQHGGKRRGIGEGTGEPGSSSEEEEEVDEGGEQPDGGAAWEQGGLKVCAGQAARGASGGGGHVLNSDRCGKARTAEQSSPLARTSPSVHA